jgi:threonine dehydratase
VGEKPPTIKEIRELRDSLGEQIVRTPTIRCAGIEGELSNGTEVYGKLEFLQRTGTFKARGALSVLKSLTDEQRRAGVTAVSAGNHAIAVAFAARSTGASAKVVMTRSANPQRVESCRAFGAEVVLADDVHRAFELAEDIQRQEGRFFVHPFEGREISMGTGTVGLEICEQCDDFDALLVPIGGGGLIGGISNAVKQLRPDCEIIGIEPEGADSMARSFAVGSPQAIDKVRTIADSLGAPFAMPYSFELCRENVDHLALVSDTALRRAMGFLYERMKIAIEPACAATTAALLGPLRESLAGKRVVLVFCGSNIDWGTYESHVIFDNAAD